MSTFDPGPALRLITEATDKSTAWRYNPDYSFSAAEKNITQLEEALLRIRRELHRQQQVTNHGL